MEQHVHHAGSGGSRARRRCASATSARLGTGWWHDVFGARRPGGLGQTSSTSTFEAPRVSISAGVVGDEDHVASQTYSPRRLGPYTAKARTSETKQGGEERRTANDEGKCHGCPVVTGETNRERYHARRGMAGRASCRNAARSRAQGASRGGQRRRDGRPGSARCCRWLRSSVGGSVRPEVRRCGEVPRAAAAPLSREEEFRAALCNGGAAVRGLAQTLDLYDAASVRVLVREMGRRIREYLEELGYELGSPSTPEEALDMTIGFFVDHGFVDLEIVDREGERIHARWHHLRGLRAYERIAAAGGATFVSCPLNAVAHDSLAAFGKELVLREKRIDMEANVAETWEEIVDLGAEAPELSLDPEQILALEREQSRHLRVRDEFIRIASHELSTPLTSTKLALARLERLPLPEAAARSVAVIRRQVQALERLVAEMLDTTRLQIGRARLDPQRADLVEIVREAAAPLAEGEGQEIALSGAPSLVGRWDAARLEQVVSNLLTNAVKYGEGRRVDVEVGARGERARIVVRDRGIGIPLEAMGRIFEPFERAASVAMYAGLGLGLYIARRIVEMHGGRITAASAPGEGSTFTVDLPIECPRGGQRHRRADAGVGRPEVSLVLIVDDNADIRETLSLLLEDGGHRPHRARRPGGAAPPARRPAPRPRDPRSDDARDERLGAARGDAARSGGGVDPHHRDDRGPELVRGGGAPPRRRLARQALRGRGDALRAGPGEARPAERLTTRRAGHLAGLSPGPRPRAGSGAPADRRWAGRRRRDGRAPRRPRAGSWGGRRGSARACGRRGRRDRGEAVTAGGAGERGDGLHHDPLEDLADGGRLGGEDAGEGLVEDDAERPDVGAVVEIGVAEDLLGRGVRGRAHHHAVARDRAGVVHGPGVGALGEAEVEDHHARHGRGGQEDVAGLEVAVDDARGVGGADGGGDGEEERRRLGHGEGAGAGEEVGEGLAHQVVHHQGGLAVVELHDLAHAAHVGVDEGGAEAGLAPEAPAAPAVLRAAADELQGHALAVDAVDRLPDDPHASLAQQALQAKARAEDGAGGELGWHRAGNLERRDPAGNRRACARSTVRTPRGSGRGGRLPPISAEPRAPGTVNRLARSLR